jgi:hypothetical protein
MVRINQEALANMTNKGFFDDWRNMKEIIKELSRSGFSVTGKKIGKLGQTLTQLCQKRILERDEIPKDKREEAGGVWVYRKRK